MTWADGKQVLVERLLNLFDASILVDGEVVLWEDKSPGAEYAARLWASTKPGMSVEVVDHKDLDMQVTRILQRGQTCILVYRNNEVQP